MKTIYALLVVTSFSTLLSACGTPVQMAGMQQPVLAQNTSMNQQTAVRAQNLQAQYMNLLLKTSYSPDVNNSHYGFDFGLISYTDQTGQPISLDLKYNAQSKILLVTLITKGDLQDQSGQPISDDKVEYINHQNHARLREVASQLRRLYTRNPQDKANLNRIASLMENPPAGPQH